LPLVYGGGEQIWEQGFGAKRRRPVQKKIRHRESNLGSGFDRPAEGFLEKSRKNTEPPHSAGGEEMRKPKNKEKTKPSRMTQLQGVNEDRDRGERPTKGGKRGRKLLGH